jgi:hypothetical protein
MTKKELETLVSELQAKLAEKDTAVNPAVAPAAAEGQFTYLLKNAVPFAKTAVSGTGKFIDRHFFALAFVFLMLFFSAHFKGIDTANWFKFDWLFNPTINASLIQKVIPDGEDRDSFRIRIRKLFETEYASDEQFQSDYRQTTSEFRWRYPALKELIIRNKDELKKFVSEK